MAKASPVKSIYYDCDDDYEDNDFYRLICEWMLATTDAEKAEIEKEFMNQFGQQISQVAHKNASPAPKTQ